MQRYQFATPRAGAEIQQEQFVVPVRLRLNEKFLQFLPIQHLHFLRLFRRQLTADGGVCTEQVIPHGPFQGGAADRVAHPHHAVGQPFAVLVGEALPATILDPTIELLQVVLCQLIQRDVTDLRNDMQADAALVGLLRSWADLRLGVILVPICQPISERHLWSHLLRLQSATLRLELLELLDALLLRFGENIFRLGVAIVIIADDDAAFPAAILSLPYGSVACFSLSCHGFNSFPKMSSMKPPTMPQACFCISVVTWV